jgi:hypothetical protein
MVIHRHSLAKSIPEGLIDTKMPKRGSLTIVGIASSDLIGHSGSEPAMKAKPRTENLSLTLRARKNKSAPNHEICPQLTADLFAKMLVNLRLLDGFIERMWAHDRDIH